MDNTQVESDSKESAASISVSISLKKCWVRGSEKHHWRQRWHILGSFNKCAGDTRHDEIPTPPQIYNPTHWTYLVFTKPDELESLNDDDQKKNNMCLGAKGRRVS